MEIQNRQSAIVRLLNEHGAADITKIVALLKQEFGIEADNQTVREDLDSLISDSIVLKVMRTVVTPVYA